MNPTTTTNRDIATTATQLLASVILRPARGVALKPMPAATPNAPSVQIDDTDPRYVHLYARHIDGLRSVEAQLDGGDWVRCAPDTMLLLDAAGGIVRVRAIAASGGMRMVEHRVYGTAARIWPGEPLWPVLRHGFRHLILMEGEHRAEGYSYPPLDSRHEIVLESEANATVSLSFPDPNGLRVARLRLVGLRIDGTIRNMTDAADSRLTMQRCQMEGVDRTSSAPAVVGFTRVTRNATNMSEWRDGCGTVVVACRDGIFGSDAYSGAQLVIDSSAYRIDASGTDFHPDLAQFYNGGSEWMENRIFINCGVRNPSDSQGLFLGQGQRLRDSWFEGLRHDSRAGSGVQRALLLIGECDNVAIVGGSLLGAVSTSPAEGFKPVGLGVTIRGTKFSHRPPDVAGVKYEQCEFGSGA